MGRDGTGLALGPVLNTAMTAQTGQAQTSQLNPSLSVV